MLRIFDDEELDKLKIKIDYINQKKEIIASLTKIINFFKSIMIYQNIFI